MNLLGRVAFLPWVPITLKSLKPKELKKPGFEPETVGEHVRYVRLLRGLSQPQAAALIGVDDNTILNWEKNRTEPPASFVPAILRFLGYDPYPDATTTGERLAAKRRAMGWPIKEAANRFGVDEGTWGAWERGETILFRKHRELVARLLGLPLVDIYREMREQLRRARS